MLSFLYSPSLSVNLVFTKCGHFTLPDLPHGLTCIVPPACILQSTLSFWKSLSCSPISLLPEPFLHSSVWFILYNLYVVHSHWYYSANHISVNHISFLFIAVRVCFYLKGLELINVTQIFRVKWMAAYKWIFTLPLTSVSKVLFCFFVLSKMLLVANNWLPD